MDPAVTIALIAALSLVVGSVVTYLGTRTTAKVGFQAGLITDNEGLRREVRQLRREVEALGDQVEALEETIRTLRANAVVFEETIRALRETIARQGGAPESREK